ncbi:E3 ubiquitin-protein ligase SHPRH [Toxorhynchites rutilus septentrionalis]|uniref:E3 ubiquitin-protein ligase SHPRH n=1 Tax=Toxorhynchites rutilus septentrionalis TaxID=329112 RepID=UPI002478336F|nr:E3 ubiquitin-protein ligase SHPRH [Toxorhynchites rutilus septentrionalis]XP_055627281.1 E3 ubiquitin-protein ligase SHPRH [Toxorhynchites rutilus septentrionalis]
MEYCLADIGILRSKSVKDGVLDESLGKQLFKYNRESYQQLDESLDIKALLRDVNRIPEYELKHRSDASDSGTTFLSLFLRRLRPEEYHNVGCFLQRKRMVELFFEQIERHDFVQQQEMELYEETTTDGSTLTVSQFYDRLRQCHTADSLDVTIPEDVSHKHLRPTLRTYQTQAIRWMLDREKVPRTLPAQYVKLRCQNFPGMDFYMYLDSYEIVDEMPRATPIPPGGILADEMGLGKTVEMLGLLLYNRKKKRKFVELEEDAKISDECEFRCICSKPSDNSIITCRKCGQQQHSKCVLKNALQHPTRYICPECWRSEPLVEAGSTIIVSPVSIKMQWASEINKHIKDTNFKVLVYEGVDKSGWICPTDLAQYDVVLTDYNVLKTEIYYTATNARTSRHEKRFLNRVSPLPLIRWWRVCLDEAQMVEGVHNQTTRMVKTLPAVHRWTVTGTPIEKSVDNLYGLVHFLDYAPYNDYHIWKELAGRYEVGNSRPLLCAMARIMWRTCKLSVLDQLGIPPQTEVIHHITMSDLQNFFYRMEHAKCATAFREKAEKLGRDIRMSRMNIQTLNLIMEPLRKLRQDCTIPSVIHRSDQLTMKKLLTPNELRQHLITTNEIDCKSQLRSIASSINGMAAIYLIKRDYDRAIKMYKSTLRWADDYQGTISVDSLLQIHALHNLLEVYAMKRQESEEISSDEIANLEERCAKLEWKYIENYSNIVKNVEKELLPMAQKVQEIIPTIDGHWWRRVIFSLDRDSTRLAGFLTKLNIEVRNHSVMAESIHTVHGLDYTLTVWLDKVKKHRLELESAFETIEYFSANLNPKHLWPADVRDRIEQLVRTAFLCHLDPELPDLPAKEKRRRPTCVLCEIKTTLNLYECVIFQKQFMESTNTTEGSWQMTVQELIIRQIHSFSKKEHLDATITEEGDQYVAFMERIKAEFKEYSKYWVEINYTVAAYDELNMCRSRLQTITLEELEQNNGKKTIQQILDCEVDEVLQDLQVQKLASEREFVRLKGTLKYLQHLGSVEEIDVCPICRNLPEGKYAVLQCGHHFCTVCAPQLVKIARAQGNNVSCVVCRHRQRVQDIYYVTCSKSGASDQAIHVKGNYSNKILKIVETIMLLKAKEAEVKILIFSHWDPILLILARALDENAITHRMKSAKFSKSIEEFKDYRKGITCMLLPLKYGSKGLNLIEATHVFLVEPILNPGEELQAVGRVHRIGQTKQTFVHRFIVQNTIEETIHQTIQSDRSGKWSSKEVTVENLEQLFQLEEEDTIIID